MQRIIFLLRCNNLIISQVKCSSFQSVSQSVKLVVDKLFSADKHNHELDIVDYKFKTKQEQFEVETCNENILEEVTFFKRIDKLKRTNDLSSLITALHDCKDNNNVPSLNVILYLLDLFSSTGNKNVLMMLENICRTHYEKEICQNSIAFFKAKLHWFNKNYDKSFEILENGNYNNQIYKDVNKFIGEITIDVVSNGNGAILVLLRNFIEAFSEKCDDITLLGTLWFCLFESNLFSDKKLAMKLFKENYSYQKACEPLFIKFCAKYLALHKLNEVYDIMELLLYCQKMDTFSTLLRALFEYYYKLGNLKNCEAIFICSENLNVTLTRFQIYLYNKIIMKDRNNRNYKLKSINRINFKF